MQDQRDAILTFVLEVAGGDPDLFVSNVTIPSLTDYVWRLPSAGARRRLVISPHDTHYSSGMYYVGVYALTRASWTLTVTIYRGEDGASAFNTAKVDALMKKFTTLMVDDPTAGGLFAALRGGGGGATSDEESDSGEDEGHSEAALAHERRMTLTDRSRLQLLRTDSRRRMLGSVDEAGGEGGGSFSAASGGGSARGDGSPLVKPAAGAAGGGGSGSGGRFESVRAAMAASPQPFTVGSRQRAGSGNVSPGNSPQATTAPIVTPKASFRLASDKAPQGPAVSPESRAFLQRNMSDLGLLEDALAGGVPANLRRVSVTVSMSGGEGDGEGGADDDEGEDMELLEAADRRGALEAVARRVRAATALGVPRPAKYTLTGIKSVRARLRPGATSALEGAPTAMVPPPRGVTLRKRPRRRRRAGKTELTRAILSASAPVLPRIATAM